MTDDQSPRLFHLDKNQLVSLTVIVTLIVSSIVAVIIIGATLSLLIFYPEAVDQNDTLANWGGIIIGYYFGSSNVIILLLGVRRRESS